jgi:Asp-tRNA(Asn)/Glu-tRNA(Gln) amidotransferase A subunit family amidase
MVNECLERYSKIDPWLHAFSWLDPHRAARLAKAADLDLDESPLRGVPVGVKDIFDTAGIPTEHGSPLFAGRVPTQNSEVVERIEKAGGIVVGKTVTAEMAFLHPGPTVNPWNPRRTPGGSSMGSAAAVAAGIVPLAVGTQTNGSVIRPAAFCGVVGFKPSAGIIPRGGALVFSPTLDQVGVFARTVRDAGLLAGSLAGTRIRRAPAGSVDPLRFCVLPRSTMASADPSMLAQFESDVAGISALGGEIEFLIPPAGFEQALQVHRTIMSVEGYWCLANVVSSRPEIISNTLKMFLEEGARTPASTYRSALALRRKLMTALAARMSPFDALLTIPTSGEAPSLETTGDPRFCTAWTLIGAPAITIPTGLGPHGLPLGLQLVGRVARDARLLRAAEWVAEHLPQLSLRPPQSPN